MIIINHMNNTILLSLLILSGLFFCTVPVKAANEWQLSKQQNGINVYVRETPDSPLKSFKGEVLINSSLTPLVAILEDTTSFVRWMYQTKSSRVLKQINDTTSAVYVVTDMPWPVMDRDSVTIVQLTQDKQTKIIQITAKSTPDYIKPIPGRFRIRDMHGKWLFIPQGKHTTRVIYEMRVDPGGNLPKWIVNALSVDLPFHTLNNLRREVMATRYQNAKRSYILE